MKSPKSPKIVILQAALLLASAIPLHAQNIDWGAWTSNGSGLYSNGATITISSVVNGSVVNTNNEQAQTHVIGDPAFPYANAPGAGEYGFFHNEAATADQYSVKIDLSGFSLNSESVIGFSNLDGIDYLTGDAAAASILFYDELNQQVSVSSATFVGTFDNQWAGVNWQADSAFNLSTGLWTVTPRGPSYMQNVGKAFFLTNLPTNITSIVYTKLGTTNYLYDSTLFYAGNSIGGNAVPEPAGALMLGLAGATGLLRRRRR